MYHHTCCVGRGGLVNDVPAEVMETYFNTQLSYIYPDSTKEFKEETTARFMEELGTRCWTHVTCLTC